MVEAGKFLRRSLLVMTAALSVGLARPARAQDETDAGKGNPRDIAAAKAALDGWWSEALKTRDQRVQWWRDARFGCFIHWGVYSSLGGEFEGQRGGGYSEHIMRQLKIPLATYKEKVVANFDPEQFDADAWVKLIKGAGMKYVCITAKHHDGFAMYPSDAYPYDIRETKFKRDPMAELSAACRKNGVRFGFYYSHAFDWEHPDAPGNDWDYPNPGGDRGLFGGKNWYDAHPELVEKASKYVDEKAIPQLKELIAKYHPDIFWFDVGGKLPFSLQLKIVQAVRAADPNVVINGRAARGMGRNWGDYADTSDRPAEVRPTAGDWECIPTCNESYGYHKFDDSYKPPSHFIRLLAKAGAKGGNVLLNIGPMGTGEIDPNSTAILQGIGKWMDVNGESIWAVQRTPLDRQAWGDSTAKGNTLYLHVFDWPSDGNLVVGGLKNQVVSAHLLADPQKAIKADRFNENDVLVQLPAEAPDTVDSVIALQLDRPAEGVPGRLLATNVPMNQFLAFDGDVHGKGFKYGDGKTGNYCVSGFAAPSNTISWNARINGPGAFDVSVKYSTASENQTGSYAIKIGDQTVEGRVKPTKNGKDMQTAAVGRVELTAGDQPIVLTPTSVAGGDLMSLFEVDLTPVKN